MDEITYQTQPYTYIITLAQDGVHNLPSGSIHAEIRKCSNINQNAVDHTWFGEIKYTSGNSYFLLYATTSEISDENISNAIYININSNTISLTNKFTSSQNLQITILQ